MPWHMISIHEVFADLDLNGRNRQKPYMNFNPRGLRRPRLIAPPLAVSLDCNFNPRGLRRPRRSVRHRIGLIVSDFNPRGLRRPRRLIYFLIKDVINFNPRGLRRPRPSNLVYIFLPFLFQSTRSSQTSTVGNVNQLLPRQISIHEVFADLDALRPRKAIPIIISIHEVFADLDPFRPWQ